MNHRFQHLVDLSTDAEEAPDLSGPMGEAVKKALEARREEKQNAAVEDVLEVLCRMDDLKENSRQKIKRLRREMNQLVKMLNAIDRAWAFARETNNFLPLLI